jgi:hypothetical protein
MLTGQAGRTNVWAENANLVVQLEERGSFQVALYGIDGSKLLEHTGTGNKETLCRMPWKNASGKGICIARLEQAGKISKQYFVVR